MTRVFRKPPVLEALCEFRFTSETLWDWVIPGLVYERIRDEFPVREQQNVLQMQVGFTPEGVTPNAQSGVGQMQFWRPDRSAIVQVGPDHLSVNCLRPYPGWLQFKPLIERVLGHYQEAAEPSQLISIALRYINRIELPPAAEKRHIQEFTNVYPRIPDDEKQSWQSWAQRVEIVKPELNAIFVVQAGSQIGAPQQEGAPLEYSIMLDLAFVHASTPDAPVPVPFENVSSWLETAHGEIEEMFLQSVTEESRTLFEEQTNDSNSSN